MKRFFRRACLFCLASLLLTGCFETTEELTIADNGSGTYKMVFDLSGLFEMFDAMQAMDTAKTSDNGFPKEAKDTTINLRSFTDTAAALTAEQKALYRNATLNLRMNEKEKEFRIDMNMPFEKLGDVEKLMALLSSQEGGGVLANAFQKTKTLGNEAAADNSKMPDLNSYYDMAIRNGSLERKLNKKKYDSLMQQYAGQMPEEGMGDMLSSIKMNTVIHLPKAAKKVTAARSTLSADKKTVTIKGSLADLFRNPQVFSYRIEY